jgi:hypothetical protein
VLLAKKNKATAAAAARMELSPWLGRHRAGVVLRGRF